MSPCRSVKPSTATRRAIEIGGRADRHTDEEGSAEYEGGAEAR